MNIVVNKNEGLIGLICYIAIWLPDQTPPFSVKIIYSLGQVIVTVNVSLATLFDTQYIDKQKSYGVVTYHLILD